MGDVNFTVDFTANRDNFARATQQTVADLNKVGDTAVRQDNRQRSLQRFSDQQARAARQARRDAVQTLTVEQQITRLKERQVLISQRLTRAAGNEYRTAALRARQAAVGSELRGLEARAATAAAVAAAAAHSAQQRAVAAAAAAAARAAATAESESEALEHGLSHTALHEAGVGQYGRMARRLGVPLTIGNLLRVGGLGLLASTPFMAGRMAKTRQDIMDQTGLDARGVQGLQYAAAATGRESGALIEEWRGSGIAGFRDFLTQSHPDVAKLAAGFRGLSEGMHRSAMEFENWWMRTKAGAKAGVTTFFGGLGGAAINLSRLGGAAVLAPFSAFFPEAEDAAAELLMKNYQQHTDSLRPVDRAAGVTGPGAGRFLQATNQARWRRNLLAGEAPREMQRLRGLLDAGREVLTSEAFTGGSSLSQMGIYATAAEAHWADAQMYGQERIISELQQIREQIADLQRRAGEFL